MTPSNPTATEGQNYLDAFGINVIVDGRPYRALANEDRTEFNLAAVRQLEITTGSVLADEKRIMYRVEQCAEMIGGNARLRVRRIS